MPVLTLAGIVFAGFQASAKDKKMFDSKYDFFDRQDALLYKWLNMFAWQRDIFRTLTYYTGLNNPSSFDPSIPAFIIMSLALFSAATDEGGATL